MKTRISIRLAEGRCPHHRWPKAFAWTASPIVTNSPEKLPLANVGQGIRYLFYHLPNNY